MRRAQLDLFAMAGSVLAVAMLGVYLAVMRQQDDRPATWVVAAFLAGACAAGYGAVGTFPHRRAALVLASLVLVALGMLAILTIGLPVLVAGALCLVAISRRRPTSPP